MDNNNFTQNNNQTDVGWQNTGQQGFNQNYIYQQNMGQPNGYQQSMMQQGMYQQNTYQQTMYQQNPYQQSFYVRGNQPRLTRKEFVNLPQMGNVKKNINACAILLYFVAGYNFVMGITGSSSLIVLCKV